MRPIGDILLLDFGSTEARKILVNNRTTGRLDLKSIAAFGKLHFEPREDSA